MEAVDRIASVVVTGPIQTTLVLALKAPMHIERTAAPAEEMVR
jgi:hypothetical protein